MIDKPPMLLLIDAGNTRVKWACIAQDFAQDGLHFPPAWEAIGSVSHQGFEQLSQAIAHFSVVSCLISNVAGDSLQAEIEQRLQVLFPSLPIRRFRSQAICAGVRNHYLEPTKLGSDRFASMIAAHTQFCGQDLIVATCGTATTIDAITDSGDFLGGMILPGLQLMASSLAKNTAQLPQIAQHTDMPNLFATQTDQAIASGCVHAQIGAILSAVARFVEQHQRQPLLLISGGAAPYLIPQLRHVKNLQWQHVENLVLTGLWIASQAETSIHS